MQIKDIELFLETASSRNITKASEQLSMSQSVVSTKIKKLEQELGYPLFVRNRGGREIELTREGQEFTSVARRWLDLFEEAELIGENALRPQLIIGAPVGFLNVVQSKELIMDAGVPCIVARGRKGGSSVAAAICNALLYMLRDEGAKDAR